MIRSLLCFFLLAGPLTTWAQTSLSTLSDTIGFDNARGRAQTGSGYSYYGASQLAAHQLNALLKRSPDSTARTLAGQSRRLEWVSTGLVVSSLGFFIGSLAPTGRRTRLNGPLLAGGYGALFGSLIPQSLSRRRLAQAIAAHNTHLRNVSPEYVPPVVYGSTHQWPLSLADTIARRRRWLTWHYSYRGVEVSPSRQVGRLTASLNDHDVNQGIRYVRTIGGISSLVGGIGRGLLTGYVTGLLLTRRYRRNTSLDNDIFTTSLLCIGANFVLSRHTNRIQRRWVDQYNEQLRQQFGSQ